MKFSATLRGVTYSDPQEFAAAVKAAPPLEPFSRGGKPVTVKMGPQASHGNGIKARPVFKKPRVTLTQPEREWLGATLRRSDGLVGQVWSLGPTRAGATILWLAVDGKLHQADTASVSFVEGVDNLSPLL